MIHEIYPHLLLRNAFNDHTQSKNPNAESQEILVKNSTCRIIDNAYRNMRMHTWQKCAQGARQKIDLMNVSTRSPAISTHRLHFHRFIDKLKSGAFRWCCVDFLYHFVLCSLRPPVFRLAMNLFASSQSAVWNDSKHVNFIRLSS